MGNWLENLMNKMDEKERKTGIKKAKEQEIARVEQEKEMSKRETIKADLRNTLVKYRVPNLLTDVKDTVWKKGEIVEESHVTGPEKSGWFDPLPNFCWFAMALVYKGQIGISKDTFWDTRSIPRKHVMPTYVDAVIVGVKAIRQSIDIRSLSPKSLYFRSGRFLQNGMDSPFSQFSPRDREKMKKYFGCGYTEHDTFAHKPVVTIGIDTWSSESYVIPKLQDLLAKDSFNRSRGNRHS